MRALVLTLSAFIIVMAAQTQAMDWDTFRVNEPPDAESTVSFSIGYPKGWRAFQDYSEERHDIYFDLIVPAGNFSNGIICSFGQPLTPNTLKHQNLICYLVWHLNGASAKEAAEQFFTNKRSVTAYTQKSIKAIKTSAGDSGWLVESEGYLIDPGPPPAFLKGTKDSGMSVQLVNVGPGKKVPLIYHDFFFHSGRLGAIHVSIMTQKTNKSWRSQLDRMVLKTLQFNGV